MEISYERFITITRNIAEDKKEAIKVKEIEMRSGFMQAAFTSYLVLSGIFGTDKSFTEYAQGLGIIKKDGNEGTIPKEVKVADALAKAEKIIEFDKLRKNRENDTEENLAL
jgi:hypothetical protein